MSMMIAVEQFGPGLQILVGSVIGLFLIAVGYRFGAIRLRAVDGPLRLPPARPRSQLFLVLFVGVTFYLLISMAYGTFRQVQLIANAKPGVAITFNESIFTAFDWAFLSNVPPIGAALVLLAGDVLLSSDLTTFSTSALRRLGFRDPLWATWRGVVGIVIAWPLVWVVSNVCELIYAHFNYAHPTEHELLRVLHDSPSAALRGWLVIGAVVVAPFFEELLFRAHLQTLIRAMLVGGKSPVPIAPAIFTGENPPAPMLAPTEVQPAEPRAWQSWVAIVIASAIFALVHPRWMQPPIFCLSICLGYAYERTENIWVNITMHATFNAVNTLVFILATP